jgi:hypothetical protein
MSTLLDSLTKPSVTNEPPTDQELSRSNIAVIVVVIFALFLGYGIRNNAVNASRSVELGEGLPTIRIPSNWISGSSEETLLHARNPRTSSAFNAEVSVATRPLAAGEDARAARTALSLQRTQDLLRYRELTVDRVMVNGEEGLLVTYAYVADPTREQGASAPPVVVQAQDLIFPSSDNQVVIVTVAADAAAWEEQQADFDLIFDSLNVDILETDLRGTVEEDTVEEGTVEEGAAEENTVEEGGEQ